MAYLTETGNSNTRGILKGIAAGEYEIEFIAFQRVASFYCEVYAAEGAFTDDAETDQWQLIGATDGLQLVAPPVKFEIRQLAKSGDQVTIEFQSPNASGTHQLMESTDLKTWTVAKGTSFTVTGGNGVRVSVSAASSAMKFYRLAR
jgi:hypothetical protein